MTDNTVGSFSKGFSREEKELTLLSGVKATILETTGKEERLLFNTTKNRKNIVEHFLAGCTKSLGEQSSSPISVEHFKKLLTGDRTYLLLQIRLLSHGSIVEYHLDCPSCGVKSEHELDLQTILDTAEPYPHGNEREFSANIGPGILWFELPNGETEDKIAAQEDRDVNAKLRNIRLWEKTEQGNLPVKIDDLKSKWIAELRNAVKSKEATLDTTVQLKCTKCGTLAKADVLANLDFLFPGTT